MSTIMVISLILIFIMLISVFFLFKDIILNIPDKEIVNDKNLDIEGLIAEKFSKYESDLTNYSKIIVGYKKDISDYRGMIASYEQDISNYKESIARYERMLKYFQLSRVRSRNADFLQNLFDIKAEVNAEKSINEAYILECTNEIYIANDLNVKDSESFNSEKVENLSELYRSQLECLHLPINNYSLQN